MFDLETDRCLPPFSELQPQMRDWLLASVNGGKVGLIPLNHVRIIGKRKGKKQRHQFKEEAHGVWHDVATKPQAEDMNDTWSIPDSDNELEKEKHVTFSDLTSNSAGKDCQIGGAGDSELGKKDEQESQS
jgi:hypothetical protein